MCLLLGFGLATVTHEAKSRRVKICWRLHFVIGKNYASAGITVEKTSAPAAIKIGSLILLFSVRALTFPAAHIIKVRREKQMQKCKGSCAC
jgi:hypothetical protein